jgi:hypothetical protein
MRRAGAGSRRRGTTFSEALWLEGCYLEISRGLQNDVISLYGGILNRRQNIFSFQKRVIGKDFLESCTSAQQLQYIHNPDAFARDARPSAALARLDGNPLE